jgi:hypothetical protein
LNNIDPHTVIKVTSGWVPSTVVNDRPVLVDPAAIVSLRWSSNRKRLLLRNPRAALLKFTRMQEDWRRMPARLPVWASYFLSQIRRFPMNASPCPRVAGMRVPLFAPIRNKMLQTTFRCRAAIARRSQRRLSRIAKGLRTRCYSPLALARIAKGDGCVSIFRDAMGDPHDLVLAMFALAVTAVMLAAGEAIL